MTDQQVEQDSDGSAEVSKSMARERRVYEPPRLRSGEVFERLVSMTNQTGPTSGPVGC